MRVLITIALALGSCSLGAAPLARESLARYAYVLRPQYSIPQAPDGQGIWRFDLSTKSYERIHSFYYGETHGTGSNLSAFEDRLVVQGKEYFEFDLFAPRILRRYTGTSDLGGSWVFHGSLITRDQALRLNIPAGIYGYPVCPLTIGQVQQCGFIQPPGYDKPEAVWTNFDLLYRRSLDPGDTKLTLVKRLDSFGFRPGRARRQLSFDEETPRFWVWTEGNDERTRQLQRLSFLPLTSEGIGSETVLMERTISMSSGPQDVQRASTAFDFDSWTRSFLHTFYHYSLDRDGYRFTRVSTDLQTEEILDQTRNSVNEQPLAIATLSVKPPRMFIQVLPVIGEGPGANGTYWHSDAYFFNPGDTSLSFRFRRVTQPDAWRDFILQPHASMKLSEILRVLGGGPSATGGDGTITDGLAIESDYAAQAQLTVYSRTFTASADGGTYGQAVPAVPSAAGYSTHLNYFDGSSLAFWSSQSEFILDKRQPSQFRHNLGFVNDDARILTVRLRYGTDGPAGERTVTVAPHSVSNVNLESLFPQSAGNEHPPRVVVAADRPGPVWLSMVDNRTGDATFIPYTIFAMRSDDRTTLALPAVGNTPGQNGTFWRTDLYGIFPEVTDSEEPQRPLSTFQSGACGEVQARLQGMVGPAPPPGREWNQVFHRIFPDVARQFSCTAPAALGTLTLRASSWMGGYARTYTSREDGGTFGELLPFYPVGGWPVQHFSGVELSAATRVNVGLYNGLPYAVRHTLRLYAAGGSLAQQSEVNIPSHETKQVPLQTLFPGVAAGLYGLSVSPEDSEQGPGRSWAYVALVDNKTGDPTNWW